MATKYFALLTNIGAAKLANAAALGEQLKITEMAVGDGSGTLPMPDVAQTALVNELRRGPLNALTVDPLNASQIIAEQVIPESAGGWWIREIGLFDAAGDLIAVANCAETYKPQLAEGSGRTQVIRMILIVSSTDAITLKIDPSVVLATRQYVDDNIIETRTYASKLLGVHMTDGNAHQQYLKIADIGSYIPVGVPLPYPATTAPDGWLKCNGASFSATAYPLLAKVYPSLKLPDLRGEFIRGWDDGRGVDNGRGIGTTQGATSIRTAALDYYGTDDTMSSATVGTAFSQAESITNSQPAGARSPGNGILGATLTDNTMSCAQSTAGVTPGGVWISMRPRNIAFNYIVRAA
ncbi:phage tail protein [Erwinia sp. STN24]|uniref:phage tail-collar fiber domain-containing protein n=1 Tax=Erwinia sp. STN24 TaxID=3233996 RepID=UPI003521A022